MPTSKHCRYGNTSVWALAHRLPKALLVSLCPQRVRAPHWGFLSQCIGRKWALGSRKRTLGTTAWRGLGGTGCLGLPILTECARQWAKPIAWLVIQETLIRLGSSSCSLGHFREEKSLPPSIYLLAVPRAMWDLSSLTRDQTRSPLPWKHGALITGPPGIPLYSLNLIPFFYSFF